MLFRDARTEPYGDHKNIFFTDKASFSTLSFTQPEQLWFLAHTADYREAGDRPYLEVPLVM